MRLAAFTAAALALLIATSAAADRCTGAIERAWYDGPTTRYPHGVLGDTSEWSVLRVAVRMPAGCPTPDRTAIALPEALVFEDVAPRLADLDGDGSAEVIVVESHQAEGARLAVWRLEAEGLARQAATPFIGQRFRWLAPAGAADLDGDGRIEIAYVDRPHLARVLRVWRYSDGRLREVASEPGFSNHRIGEREISGGIRNCGGAPEIITASADWTRIVASVLSGGRLQTRDIGPNRGPESFAAALACR